MGAQTGRVVRQENLRRRFGPGAGIAVRDLRGACGEPARGDGPARQRGEGRLRDGGLRLDRRRHGAGEHRGVVRDESVVRQRNAKLRTMRRQGDDGRLGRGEPDSDRRKADGARRAAVGIACGSGLDGRGKGLVRRGEAHQRKEKRLGTVCGQRAPRRQRGVGKGAAEGEPARARRKRAFGRGRTVRHHEDGPVLGAERFGKRQGGVEGVPVFGEARRVAQQRQRLRAGEKTQGLRRGRCREDDAHMRRLPDKPRKRGGGAGGGRGVVRGAGEHRDGDIEHERRSGRGSAPHEGRGGGEREADERGELEEEQRRRAEAVATPSRAAGGREGAPEHQARHRTAPEPRPQQVRREKSADDGGQSGERVGEQKIHQSGSRSPQRRSGAMSGGAATAGAMRRSGKVAPWARQASSQRARWRERASR